MGTCAEKINHNWSVGSGEIALKLEEIRLIQLMFSSNSDVLHRTSGGAAPACPPGGAGAGPTPAPAGAPAAVAGQPPQTRLPPTPFTPTDPPPARGDDASSTSSSTGTGDKKPAEKPAQANGS
ncbi:hypothetical protein HDU96_001051, partial [Phlyctochytrium bullatum]